MNVTMSNNKRKLAKELVKLT